MTRTLAEIEAAGLRMGQLTRAEQKLVIAAGVAKTEAHFKRPEVQAAIKKALDDFEQDELQQARTGRKDT